MGLDGNLEGEGQIVVDGPHRGDIRAETVQIDKEGSLVGNITAKVVRVAGRLEGDVDAFEFYAAKTARVRGAIRSDVVGIMPGASVAGCSFDTRRPVPAAEDSSASSVADESSSEEAGDRAAELQPPRPEMSEAFARLAAQLAEVVAGSRDGRADPQEDAAADVEDDVHAQLLAPPAPQKRVLPKLFA